MSQEPVRLIITGGTFDKAYDSIRGELTLSRTHLPDILTTVGCAVPVRPIVQSLKDSLEMVAADREAIAEVCRVSSEERIVITHGTDTMTETADVIAGYRLNKTICLTGAMVPFAVSGSDALFNLGGAITAVQTLPHGVYIVMNGMVFSAGKVRKNRNSGVFEEVVSFERP